MPNQPPSRPNQPENGPEESPDTPRPTQGAPGGPRPVRCAKLGRELPGLPAPPFPTPLGRRIHASISKEAWQQWLLHSQMFINEKELRLSDASDRQIWMDECERFLFGSGAAPPPGWVPPSGFVRLTKKPPDDSD